MSRRILAMTTITPTAFADNPTTLTNAAYPFAIKGASSTQIINIWEVSINGQAASSSSPTFMLLAYDSVVGTGSQTQGTGGTDTPMNPAFSALSGAPGTGNTYATTPPQRSVSAKLMNCSVNAFGGVYFWRANRAEECPQINGNTQPNGEVSLSAYTGGTPGAIGTHMIYETL
jgi:hypothetical protein